MAKASDRRSRLSHTVFSAKHVVDVIRTVRRHRVVLSTEVAQLYGVEPRALVQAVKRNKDRFPPDFMFQLTAREWAALKSQFVISKRTGRGGARTPPYAFTEQGVAMLSSVLNSHRAVKVNIEIMRAFVRLRRMIASNERLSRRLDELERTMLDHDDKFAAVFEAIRQLMAEDDAPPKPRIGFVTESEC